MFCAKEVWTKDDEVDLKKLLRRQFMDVVKSIQVSGMQLKDKFQRLQVGRGMEQEPISLSQNLQLCCHLLVRKLNEEPNNQQAPINNNESSSGSQNGDKNNNQVDDTVKNQKIEKEDPKQRAETLKQLLHDLQSRNQNNKIQQDTLLKQLLG